MGIIKHSINRRQSKTCKLPPILRHSATHLSYPAICFTCFKIVQLASEYRYARNPGIELINNSMPVQDESVRRMQAGSVPLRSRK